MRNCTLLDYPPFEGALHHYFVELYESDTFRRFIIKYSISSTAVLLALYDKLEYNMVYNHDIKLSNEDMYEVMQQLFRFRYCGLIASREYYEAVELACNFN